MTLEEFKAWLDGFSEAIDEAPTAAQWKKIKDKIGEIEFKAAKAEPLPIPYPPPIIIKEKEYVPVPRPNWLQPTPWWAPDCPHPYFPELSPKITC